MGKKQSPSALLQVKAAHGLETCTDLYSKEFNVATFGLLCQVFVLTVKLFIYSFIHQ